MPLDPLLPRMWQLRSTVSGYDAPYPAKIRVVTAGRTALMSAVAGSALDVLASGDTVTVEQLPGDLGAEAVEALVRFLLRQGVLKFVDD